MIMSEPTPEVLKMQAFRSSTIQDNDFLVSTSQNSIKTVKAIHNRANQPGNIELRLVPYVPPYSIIIIQKQNNLSIAHVRLSSFRVSFTEQPTFIIHEHDDKVWFDFFKQQFELLWRESTKVELS
jgi:hypothetical protein